MPESKKNVLMVVGSFREGSYNKQLAHEIERMLDERARVSYLDYAHIPFMNEDLEPEATAEVRRVRAEVAAADAVWIVSPEYNHSVPGGLKNLIDWLSRPAETGNAYPLDHKPLALSGVGMEATAAYGLAELSKITAFVGFVPISEDPVGVHAGRKVAASGKISPTEEEYTLLQAQCDALLHALESKDSPSRDEQQPESDKIQTLA